MNKKAFAVVVGGGPAPGINGVISAATIEAINRGHKVFGIMNGFSQIMNGDASCIKQLSIGDVSRIHLEGGSVLNTSRANPTKNDEHLRNVVNLLEDNGVGHLITIGGDDTVSSARAINKAAGGKIGVGHVPKTIDNDLPIPGMYSTFGFQTAREAGTEIAETLMLDGKTTGRWYLMVAMGRKAGHLALGIGVSAGATLTIIPEEFGDEKISIDRLVNIIVGSILKRLARGQNHGLVVLAEGLAVCLDVSSVPELVDAERDPHGNIRFAEVDFGSMVKRRVRERLEELGVGLIVVEKNVGYELRCRRPITFDREYTRELGYGIVDFLAGGHSGAMITRQAGELVPMAFEEFIDPKSGRSSIRTVDTQSITYLVATKYMIRLSAADLEDDELCSQMAQHTKVTAAQLKELFLSTDAVL